MIKMFKFIVLLNIFFLTGGCANEETEKPTKHLDLRSKRLIEFYQGDITKVNHIEIRSGSTGELVTITDKQKVQDWISRVEHIEFIPDTNQEKRVGYLYFVDLFEGNERKLRFSPTDVEGHYYIYNKKLGTEIQNLFKSK
jgi:hypothetical protein